MFVILMFIILFTLIVIGMYIYACAIYKGVPIAELPDWVIWLWGL